MAGRLCVESAWRNRVKFNSTGKAIFHNVFAALRSYRPEALWRWTIKPMRVWTALNRPLAKPALQNATDALAERAFPKLVK